MHRLPEHIHRSDSFYLIPKFPQIFHIPGQSCRITADVHHPLGFHLHDCVQAGLITPFSGRVNHNHICRNMVFLILFRQNLLGLPDKKLHMFHSIISCIFTRILNGLGNHFHAIYPAGFLSQKQGNRTDAAIQIPNRLPSGKFCKFQSRPVKPLRLHRIHLEKGQRRNAKTHRANPVLNVSGPVKIDDFRSHYHVGFLPVDRQRNAVYPSRSPWGRLLPFITMHTRSWPLVKPLRISTWRTRP